MTIDAAELLARLQEIEARVRAGAAGVERRRARSISILSTSTASSATGPTPILPHPRAHVRAFVLRPLLDVAPGWRHPVLRQSVATLLAELPPQGINPWGDEAD